MRRTVTAVSVALWLLPAPCKAISLTWSNRSADLSFVSARRCTLLVQASIGETLPSDWRLLWILDSPQVPPFQLDRSDNAPNIGTVCPTEAGASERDDPNSVQQVSICATAGGSYAQARYIISFPAGVRGRIGLLQPTGSRTGIVSEVLVNHGVNLPYPPYVSGVKQVLVATGNLVLVSGAGLDSVTDAIFQGRGELLPRRLSMTSHGDTAVVLNTGDPDSLPPGYIRVANRLGASCLVGIEGRYRTDPQFPDDRLVVRFRPNQVDLPPNASSASVGAAYFSASALRETLATTGVTRLERAFPTFRHADVRSENRLGEHIRLDDLADFYLAYLSPGTDIQTARQRLNRQGTVLLAEPDNGGRVALSTIPNDPAFPRQWGLRDTGQVLCGLTSQGGDIQGPFAWDRTTGDPSIRVAIIDTGIDTTHQDLAGHVRGGTSFVPGTFTSQDSVPTLHGTGVAGILGATGYNAQNVAGVAWRPTLWAVKAITAAGYSQSTWVQSAIAWTRANHFPIVNMSLGFGETSCQGYATITPAAAVPLNAACLNSFYDGTFLVASTGNCNAQVRYYPAAFTKRVFAVGAYFLDGARWEDYNFASHNPAVCPTPTSCEGSSFGPWVDAVAPGGRLIITLGQGPSGANDISPTCNASIVSGMAFGGTSAAAPHAAGIAALLMSYNPSLVGEDIENILHITAAHSLPNPNDFYGYGYLKAAAALAFVGSGNLVMHGTIGAFGTHGSLADRDSARVVRRFNNVPTLPGDGSYICWRHHLQGRARFSGGFSFNPYVWTRGSGTLGWRDTTVFDYNEEVNWGRIFGALSPSGDSMETFVYRILDPSDTTRALGWFPVPPSDASIAFTAVGQPNINGVLDNLPSASLAVSARPNPARGSAKFTLSLPRRGWAWLDIVDPLGRRIRRVANQFLEAGQHEFVWDAKDEAGQPVRPGVYFVKAVASDQIRSGQLVVLPHAP